MKKNIIIGVLSFFSITLVLFAFVAKTQAEEAKKMTEMMTIEAEIQKQIAIECAKQAQEQMIMAEMAMAEALRSAEKAKMAFEQK